MVIAREALRLMLSSNHSNREIGRICSVAHSTIGQYRKQIDKAGLSLEQIEKLNDEQLSHIIKDKRGKKKSRHRPQPDFKWIHQELKKKGVTLQLLWEEYKGTHPDGYESTQFNHLYRKWSKKLNPSMRQTHIAGEKVFVDFSGHTIPIKSPEGGPEQDAEIFVAVLGASNYTYAEATLSQGISNWIECHINTFGYFNGVPELIVPDNLKSAVNKPCRYEPVVNRSFLEMASHYETAVLPARARKPKDKAKAEVGVQIVSRWILAKLRNRIFFCITELNDEIIYLLEELNHRPFKKLKGTRHSVFKSLEQPELKSLPALPYAFANWKKVRVNLDYHVELDQHYYSVPYSLIHQHVFLRYTSKTVEIFHNNKRVASHLNSTISGGNSTVMGHMPKSHQQHLKWTPSKIVAWSRQVGESTSEVIQGLINSDRHAEQSYRSCLGIKRLSAYYSAERIEAACKRAIAINGRTYKSIKSILKTGLDVKSMPPAQDQTIITHDNLRGNTYYALDDHPIQSGEYPC